MLYGNKVYSLFILIRVPTERAPADGAPVLRFHAAAVPHPGPAEHAGQEDLQAGAVAAGGAKRLFDM